MVLINLKKKAPLAKVSWRRGQSESLVFFSFLLLNLSVSSSLYSLVVEEGRSA
jgi:hypothetical protein